MIGLGAPVVAVAGRIQRTGTLQGTVRPSQRRARGRRFPRLARPQAAARCAGLFLGAFLATATSGQSFETTYLNDGPRSERTPEWTCAAVKRKARREANRYCDLGGNVNLAEWFVAEGCRFATPMKSSLAHDGSMCGCDCGRYQLGSIPIAQTYGMKCAVRWQCPVIPEPEPEPAPAPAPSGQRSQAVVDAVDGRCRLACEPVRFNIATCNSGRNPADAAPQYRLDAVANDELVSCVRTWRKQPEAVQPWFTVRFDRDPDSPPNECRYQWTWCTPERGWTVCSPPLIDWSRQDAP